MELNTRDLDKMDVGDISREVSSKYHNVDSWNDKVYVSFYDIIATIKRTTDDIDAIVNGINMQVKQLEKIDSKKTEQTLNEIASMIASLS